MALQPSSGLPGQSGTTSFPHEVGTALGAQAGDTKLIGVITAGGLTSARRATESPFNLILEARP